MNYELRKVVPPASSEVEYDIIIGGETIGRLRDPSRPTGTYMAMLDVSLPRTCVRRSAYGHGDTADEAIANAAEEAAKLAEEFGRIAALARTHTIEPEHAK